MKLAMRRTSAKLHAKGMTQKEAARLLGVSERTLGRYLLGRRMWPLDVALDFNDLLGAPPGEVYALCGQRPKRAA